MFLGKQSSRWWQTKSAISFIVGSLTIILWMIFAVTLGQLLLFDFACNVSYIFNYRRNENNFEIVNFEILNFEIYFMKFSIFKIFLRLNINVII